MTWTPAGSLPDTDDPVPRYRAGAVARLLGMPVATLRIWEQRYQVSSARTSASGHRMYSANDVRRLALLRHLTELGHAISGLAPLGFEALQEVAASHARTVTRVQTAATGIAAWRVTVVGDLLADRVLHPSVRRRLGRPLELLARSPSLAAAKAGPPLGRIDAPDLLLVQVSGLGPGLVDALLAVARAWRAPQVGVVYGYGATSDLAVLEDAGIHHLRDPQDDAALARWMQALAGPPVPVALGPAASAPAPVLPDGQVPPRRHDDVTLAEMAAVSSTIACECPRHVAELLMRLTQFEDYSANCRNRSPSDAALHAYLQQVAGTARAMFETALERIAAHEGLSLDR